MPKFEIVRAGEGRYLWQYRADDQQIVASSAVEFPDKLACILSIGSITEEIADRVKIRRHSKGHYRWQLYNGSELIAASSQGYPKKTDCQHAVQSFRKEARGAFIDDHALDAKQAPVASFTIMPSEGKSPLDVILDASPSHDPDGIIIGYEWDFGDGQHGAGISVSHIYSNAGNYSITLTVTDKDGLKSIANRVLRVSSESTEPQEPSETNPALDRSVVTSLLSTTRFIYTGDAPLQTGIDPQIIRPQSVAVLRGKVLTRSEKGEKLEPLSNVRISIHECPELGSTVSRKDGVFDMVVNGGRHLSVKYEKEGYLSARRRIGAKWQNYTWLPDTILLPQNAPVATVSVNSNLPIQVARGREIPSDVMKGRKATRQATLLFPNEVVATVKEANGREEKLGDFQVSITEFTVGPAGPASMPAELPPNSGYTYAVELSVAGSENVEFSQPVIQYLENFLGFPVGGVVPAGYYAPQLDTWVPAENGRVIAILRVREGMAELDLEGKGQAAKPNALRKLGITEAERRQLAEIYQPGQSLWRVPIKHFSAWDFNWPFGPPKGATPPGQPPPEGDDGSRPDKECGSIIGVQNQVLSEAFEIAGTPFKLYYHSDRVPGRRAAYSLKIPLSGNELPTSLKSIELEIYIAGQRTIKRFDPTPNLNYPFTWDGRDVYENLLQGRHRVTVRIGYTYDAVYQEPAEHEKSFAQYSESGTPVEQDVARKEITLWQEWAGALGVWDASGQGLGGWSIDAHHGYDPVGQTLYLGDGGRSNASYRSAALISTFAAEEGKAFAKVPLRSPTGIAVASDGTVYVVDSNINGRVHKITPDGRVIFYVGASILGEPEVDQPLMSPYHIELAPDDSLYIADTANHRILRIGKDKSVTRVAGKADGEGKFSGDGGPATRADLNHPAGIAVGADGSLYIADSQNHRIRCVGVDGIIRTVAGTGQEGEEGDGGPALKAQFNTPMDIAVAPDGTFYIADDRNHLIRRVGNDGVVSTVAGGRRNQNEDEEQNVYSDADSSFYNPTGITIGPDGALYIACSNMLNTPSVRRLGTDGVMTTVAGAGPRHEGDGGLAVESQFDSPEAVALAPDGKLYVADNSNKRPGVYRITSASEDSSLEETVIASEDGSQLYVFDAAGRHRRTLEALTLTPLYLFAYDAHGRLIEIKDSTHTLLRVERGADGTPSAIVGAGAQRTILKLDSAGYLTQLTPPGRGAYQFAYQNGGLLINLTRPSGQKHHFTYEDGGWLMEDKDPAGGVLNLVRESTDKTLKVKVLARVSSLFRERSYEVEQLPGGGEQRINKCCGGTVTKTSIGRDHTRTVTQPDGTLEVLKDQPDPRFGQQAPILQSDEIRTPKGLRAMVSFNRSVKKTAGVVPATHGFTDTLTLNERDYTTIFDPAQKQLTVVTPEKRQKIVTLDEKGRVRTINFLGRAPVTYDYDARGRLVKAVTGLGQQERAYLLEYDARDLITKFTAPLNISRTVAYNEAGRPASQKLFDGREIKYQYDVEGNLTSIAPPGRPGHSFKYTALNLLAEYLPPEADGRGGSTRYEYNLTKQLTRVIQSDGATIDLAYDEAGRLASIASRHGKAERSYDPATGQLSKVTATDGVTTSYEYDGFLLTGTKWSGIIKGVIRRTYDDNFRVASLSLMGKEISFDYDKDGFLTQAGEIVLKRNAKSGLCEQIVLGELKVSYEYNDFGEITRQRAASGKTVLLGIEYARDPLGRVVAKTDTIGKEVRQSAYIYDLAGRLAEVTSDGAATGRYTYDENSNLSQAQRPGQMVKGVYDVQDRLLQWADSAYEYAVDGTIKRKTDGRAKQITTYEYDALGNLRRVVLPDETSIEYLNDGLNRRVAKMVGGKMVQGFLYHDFPFPIAELGVKGQVVARFIYASRLHVPDMILKGENTYLVITDHLGSPRLVVDAISGEIVQRIDYDEFGNLTLDTNPGFQPFGFAGGLYDRQTKLTRFGLRDYDAQTGRWTAKDPLLFGGGSENLYVYASNDPVNQIDPLGLYDWPWPLNGAVYNRSGQSVYVLRSLQPGEKCPSFLRLPSGQSTRDSLLNSDDIDGVYVNGIFYIVSGRYNLVIDENGNVFETLIGDSGSQTRPAIRATPQARGLPDGCPEKPPPPATCPVYPR